MKVTKKLDYRDQDIYIGIDVHKRTWSVTFVTESSNRKTVSFERPFVRNLVRYAVKNYPNGNYQCVYEAGFSGFWAYRKLEAAGIKTIIVNPADIPTTDKDRKNKTDVRDSRKLAITLRSGELSGIFCPSEQQEKDRALLRVRNQIAKLETQTKNRIKSSLLFFGIAIPEEFDNSGWSSRMINWLKHKAQEMDLKPLSFQLCTLDKIRQEHAEVLKALRRLSRTSRHRQICEILESIPGIGPLTSIKLKLELISMQRFNTTDQLLSYIGLIPNTNSSGDNIRVGRMTKRQKGDLKKSIVESAWVAIRYDHHLGIQYTNWKKTKGANKAIIKVAVKLVKILRCMWKNQKKYIYTEI